MTNLEAINNLKELGHVFAVAMVQVTSKDIGDKSDLMNGIAAYEILKLKGQMPHIDESIDIVMRIIYDLVHEELEDYALMQK